MYMYTCVYACLHVFLIVDIDECDFNNGGCDQLCLNGNGTFVCDCRDGYSLHGNHYTCIGKYIYHS